jgi:DNA-binding response OmpR family regulator
MSDPARILIVDDEPNVRFVLERALRREKYILDTAADGRQALARIQGSSYDLVILDLQMQPIPGMQVLETLRRRSPHTAVIILTGHSTVDTAVEALRLGAFDYLFKPVTPDAIRRRVREGLAHRAQEQRRTQVLQQVDELREALLALNTQSTSFQEERRSGRFRISGPLTIDLRQRAVVLRGCPVDLTTAEFNILLSLVQHAPDEVAPRQLVNLALEYDAGEAGAAEIVRYHIHQLRGKIEADPQHPRLIRTIRYRGYLWTGE